MAYDDYPPPEGEVEGSPELMRPQLTFFLVADASDWDTVTMMSSGSCKVVSGLQDDDVSYSYWEISDPGVDDIEPIVGLAAEYITEPWDYESDGEGDYGSYATTSATFFCNDGRDSTDPAHDCHALGSVSTTKLVPDEITTELGGPYCWGGNQLGQCFEHTVLNRTYPDYSFQGMTLQEEITDVICDVVEEDAARRIVDAATCIWRVQEDNSWLSLQEQPATNDCHVNSGDVATLLDDINNSYVLLLQVYHIISWNWPEKNPEHHIGQEKDPTWIIDFSGFHTILFQQYDESFTLVTKDSVNCGSTENTCPPIE
ncbi:MAG TPA: hypothetical protein PK468_19540 [Candidatus Hydrogenedentes bacterium]|nr:hypothetical protein [Candidatus Hydrogenedentota bacterium]